MKIEDNAFKNCLSLKEFHFEKIDEIPDFKSRFNDGISTDYVVIVKDKLYKKWLEENFEVHLLSKSQYVQRQIDNLENSNIIKVCQLLDKTKLLVDKDFSYILDEFIKKLYEKYNIQQKDIDKFQLLVLRKNRYESE